jgi:hypothetical protein
MALVVTSQKNPKHAVTKAAAGKKGKSSSKRSRRSRDDSSGKTKSSKGSKAGKAEAKLEVIVEIGHLRFQKYSTVSVRTRA